MTLRTLPLLAALALLPLPLQAQPGAQPNTSAPAPALRQQLVAPLPGGLDPVLVVNDNNPELITAPGILLSTFDGKGRGIAEAHLNVPLNGRFDLFSHHVFAGKPESLDSTLWLAVVAQPRGNQPVALKLLGGSTALSQSLDPAHPGAPFLPLPALMPQGMTPVYAGPGSRVATELLARQRSGLPSEQWTLEPGQLSTLMVLPIPVRGLDPLLNGRNLQLRLQSDGPMSMAVLAAFGPNDQPPPPQIWAGLLEGPLSPREHKASPKGAPGPMIYSRVSGVQRGSVWTARITDPGKPYLSTDRAPISWPIASLERGTLGTGQVQTAELAAYYPGTAWAAHGNYGVEYDLTLPLRNTTARPVSLQLAFESPLKGDQDQGGLRFLPTPARAVMFRGTVEVSGLDAAAGRVAGRQSFHLVLRNGQQGPALGTVTLAPGASRPLRVRLIYPADATPPQVLSLLPLPPAQPADVPVKQSPPAPASSQP
ncbi:MAG: DUF3370 domain-containing protein [Cyanobacteriota bacterium]|nr:DUF3370 domain-containing protein [Cyanobacteriota bacterium]